MLVPIDGREKTLALAIARARARAKSHGKREGYAVIDGESDSGTIEIVSERDTHIYTQSFNQRKRDNHS